MKMIHIHRILLEAVPTGWDCPVRGSKNFTMRISYDFPFCLDLGCNRQKQSTSNGVKSQTTTSRVHSVPHQAVSRLS